MPKTVSPLQRKMSSESGQQFLRPRPTSAVRKAVSNMRNSDGAVRARVHFTEDPENAYIRKLMDRTVGTAVIWDVQGLQPHAIFELHIRDFGDLRSGSSNTGSTVIDILTMTHIVICGGESGWRYRTKKGEGLEGSREAPVLVADEAGKAQGVSIERGLRVQDVLGKVIVIQEIGVQMNVTENDMSRRRGPALGIIGCQCRTSGC